MQTGGATTGLVLKVGAHSLQRLSFYREKMEGGRKAASLIPFAKVSHRNLQSAQSWSATQLGTDLLSQVPG